ncbi:MAG TPA: biotin carboxylase N-terminal domain-containing protein [Acidimicrobiales bacterium]|nr:biotin carboxylase N-terminal domain-containing protein [Acidimicrobiales bacterium]
MLVANRGEIAVRIFRTLRRMGISPVAVYSRSDADARHVGDADRALLLGGEGAAAYLDVDAVVTAALDAAVDAVHPGYGFLSENPRLAAAVDEAGLAWIGPPATAIEAMGDKIRAKETVSAWGVPIVPGGGQPGMSDHRLRQVAAEVGFPVLIKPSAGGGGKGMHVVDSPEGMAAALAAARREAAAAFGDDTLLIERLITSPRHIEIQVMADTHGAVVHLGERECSLQRRHQKVVEEAPSPLVATRPGLRDRMGSAAVDAARAVGYAGAGTVEFVVAGDRPDDFFFMEMNTRLQVEHPVTEMVTGIDLVEWQVRVAAGQPLGFTQDDVDWSGHAVEARVYAENPARGFLPTGGRVLAWAPPLNPGVRVDAGIAAGDAVTSDFDPMMAKVVAWGHQRSAALESLDAALAGTVLLGVGSNVAFLRRLLSHPDVQAGAIDTGLIERHLAALAPPPDPDDLRLAAVAGALLRWRQAWAAADPHDPWSTPTGWRVGAPAWWTWRTQVEGDQPVEVRVRPSDAARGRAEVVLVPMAGAGGGGTAAAGEGEGDGAAGAGEGEGHGAARGRAPAVACRVEVAGDRLTLWRDGRRWRFAWAEGDGRLWLGRDGDAWVLSDLPLADSGLGGGAAAGAGTVRSPMPGVVRVLRISEGDAVLAGQELLAVEAMKMEYSVTAGVAGSVRSVRVREGQRVALDEVLAEIVPEG